MKIGVNASFARKADTGIGQVTVNFIKKLTEFPISNFQFPNKSQIQNSKSKNVEFILYLEEDIELKLPKNFTKKIFQPFWKRDDLIRKIWWEKYSLPRQVKKDGCDVFLSLYQSATILPKKVKHLMLVHDIIPYLFPEYLDNARKRKYYSLTRRAVERADKIIAISKRTEKDLVRHWHLDPAKITVAYLDADEIYKKKVSPAESAKVLKKYKLKPGYIYNAGGLDARKNIGRLIQAYNHLLENNRAINWMDDFPQLAIAGKLMPEMAPLIFDAQKMIDGMNLNNHVKLLDFVPQKEMPALYHNASVFVYPSLYEGFGLPVLEAMNQGVPVAASKHSSVPEVGLDSVLYFDPQDEKDLSMVIKNVLLNKNLRETLKKRGKERARNFSWDKFVKKIINIARAL